MNNIDTWCKWKLFENVKKRQKESVDPSNSFSLKALTPLKVALTPLLTPLKFSI